MKDQKMYYSDKLVAPLGARGVVYDWNARRERM